MRIINNLKIKSKLAILTGSSKEIANNKEKGRIITLLRSPNVSQSSSVANSISYDIATVNQLVREVPNE